MIEHNDDAYVMMLLTMPLSPIGDGSLAPLTADEFASLGALLEPNTSVRLRQLLGQDVAGLESMLGIGEEFAYRLCLLLSRQLLLGRLIEDTLNSGTEIITPFDRQYPENLKYLHQINLQQHSIILVVHYMLLLVLFFADF